MIMSDITLKARNFPEYLKYSDYIHIEESDSNVRITPRNDRSFLISKIFLIFHSKLLLHLNLTESDSIILPDYEESVAQSLIQLLYTGETNLQTGLLSSLEDLCQDLQIEIFKSGSLEIEPVISTNKIHQ